MLLKKIDHGQFEWFNYLQNSGLSFAVVIFIYKGKKQK